MNPRFHIPAIDQSALPSTTTSGGATESQGDYERRQNGDDMFHHVSAPSPIQIFSRTSAFPSPGRRGVAAVAKNVDALIGL